MPTAQTQHLREISGIQEENIVCGGEIPTLGRQKQTDHWPVSLDEPQVPVRVSINNDDDDGNNNNNCSYLACPYIKLFKQ